MKRAFSLIELLVVIAIIGILAAILFPVFARVRENGRRAACHSNLKQIGLGLIQYSQDYDEVLIADWYGTDQTIGPGPTLPLSSAPNVSYKWADAAFPYVKSEQVFNCSSATASAAVPYRFYQTLSAPRAQNGSYIIMHGYGANQAGKTPPVSHPLASINDTVKLSQTEAPATTAWVLDGDGNFYCQVASARVGNIVDRHLETIGVLFLDGHVKAIRLDTLNTPNSNGVLPMATLQDD